jgi:hypothetical protein
VLKNIFGSKREDVTGDWRQMHKEKLHDLHYSPNIIRIIKSRRMIFAEHVAHMGESRSAYTVLAGKPERRRPFG